MNRIPASVIVLSIIGFFYAALNVLGTGASFVLTFWMSSGFGGPTMEFLRNDALGRVSVVIDGIVYLILALMVIIGSIQSLLLAPSGRRMMILFARYNLIYTVVSLAFHFVYVMPKVVGNFTGSDLLVEVVSDIFALLVILAYCFCILYFYDRPRVREAFNGVPAILPAFPVGSPPGDSARP